MVKIKINKVKLFKNAFSYRRYDTMATGVVFFHRFYMFHSFNEFSRYVSKVYFFLFFLIHTRVKKTAYGNAF